MKKATPRRPSPRVAQKRADTRLEILRAAEEIMTDGGIDAVTLASVAGQLHLTKQALYHYFPSKEALIKSLTTTLLHDEIESVIATIEAADSRAGVLGTMIRAFYAHYIGRLDAFKAIYCQSQLHSPSGPPIDKLTILEEINPRTRHLFNVLEDRLSGPSKSKAKRARMRRLAFSAWLSALGLLTMLSLADANQDPLVHSDKDLLDTLARVFDEAALK